MGHQNLQILPELTPCSRGDSSVRLGGRNMVDTKAPDEGLVKYYEATVDYARKTQSEYSRWLINTLYLLHSGAIAGILTRVPSAEVSKFIPALSWFVVGIALAFTAGMAAWTNFHWFIDHYNRVIHLCRRGEWQPPDSKPPSTVYIRSSWKVALGFVICSFCILIVGSFKALRVWSALTP